MGIGRADRIAIDAAGANPGSPAPLDGVIEPQHQRSVRDEGGQQHTKQDETGMPTTPDGTVQSPMIVLKMMLVDNPITRRALVTVRLPGARTAPIRRTCAQPQTRWENRGRNARMMNASSAGRVGMQHFTSYLFYTLNAFAYA